MSAEDIAAIVPRLPQRFTRKQAVLGRAEGARLENAKLNAHVRSEMPTSSSAGDEGRHGPLYQESLRPK